MPINDNMLQHHELTLMIGVIAAGGARDGLPSVNKSCRKCLYLRKRKNFSSYTMFSILSYASISFIITCILLTISTCIPTANARYNNGQSSGGSSIKCAIQAFSSGKKYEAGDSVTSKQTIYECKPPPDSTWCSHAGYEPGQGFFWSRAWNQIGRVDSSNTGPCADDEEEGNNSNNIAENDLIVVGEEVVAEEVVEEEVVAEEVVEEEGSDSNKIEEEEKIVSTPLTILKEEGESATLTLKDEEEITTLTLEEEEEEEIIPSNHFFCGTSWNKISKECDTSQHCPTGSDDECQNPGLSCFAGTECDASKGDGSAYEEYIESDHFFCGLGWNTVSSDCDNAQHCPTGIDTECEISGASCFGGTSCDAAKGHGAMFQYLGLPYEDARNKLFCATYWGDMDEHCTEEDWCRDGNCPTGMTCFGMTNDCNIQDLVKARIKKEKEENPELYDDDDEVPKKSGLDIDDPKRNNFCGSK